MPLITGIHRPLVRSRIYVDEENDSQYGSNSEDGSNIDEEYNDVLETQQLWIW